MTKTLLTRMGLAIATLVALVGVALPLLDTSSATTSVQVAASRAAAQTGDDSVTVTLLHNNDGESKLLPNAEAGFPGVARFAQTWVDLGQASNADILLRVSSGDNFLASKEFAAGLARENAPLYDAIALRGLYEVIALGNHDFDFGPDVTARFIDDLRVDSPTSTNVPVPFVAANIDVSGEPVLQALLDQGRIAKSVVVTDPTSGMDIGVIGAITPRLPNISSPRNVVVDPDVAAAINAQVQELTDQGIDRIVLISHLQGLTEDRALVPQLSGVDIIVAGGGDELLKNDGDTCEPDAEAFDGYPLLLDDADGVTVPVVTTPGGYRCIGKLEITFDGSGAVSSFTGESIGVPLDGESEEFALMRVEEPLIEAVQVLESTVIGSSDVDLDGQRNSVRTGASNVGELLADALLQAGQAGPDFGGSTAQVALQNGGGIRNDSVIAAGELTEADTFDIAPFANFAVTVDVPRERFKELLETGVSGLPDAEGRFPQIAGFTMDIDASEPGRQVDHDGDCSLTGDTGSRVRTVTLDDGTEIVVDGQVVPGDDITLATIDFLAGGGDCYPLDDLAATKVGVSYQQALRDYIADTLGGEVSQAQYPTAGSRTTISGLQESDEATADAEPAAEEEAPVVEEEPVEEEAPVADEDDAAAADDAAAQADELPNTGVNSWLFVIVALTVAAGGYMIFAEAQRAGRISLSNRLHATQAWIPDATSNEDDQPHV